MNNIQIRTVDNSVKVIIDGKEQKAVEKIVLSLEVGKRTLEIKQFVSDIDIETNVHEIKELSNNNSTQQK